MRIGEKISQFIGDLTRRMTSRKFQGLLIAFICFWNKPEYFTGWNMTCVIAMYIGGNALEKFILREKNT